MTSSGDAGDPSHSVSRQLFDVRLVTDDSNRAVQVLKAIVLTFGEFLTQGLISYTPKSMVQVCDRRDGSVLIEYDYADLNGAAEHVRQLNERLDRETPSEFLRELGLGDAFWR